MTRLAGPDVEAVSREVVAYGSIALIVAAIFVFFFLVTPTAAPSIRANARIVRFGSHESDYPQLQSTIAVVVDIDGVGRRALIEPVSLLNRCEANDRVLVLGRKIKAGGIDWGFPVAGCSPLPPD